MEENKALEICQELHKTQVMELLRPGPSLEGPGCLRILTFHPYQQEVLQSSRLQKQEPAPPRVLALNPKMSGGVSVAWAEDHSEKHSGGGTDCRGLLILSQKVVAKGYLVRWVEGSLGLLCLPYGAYCGSY